VSTATVAGVGSVLVDRSGKTLYYAGQEADGTLHCTGDCLNFWFPAVAAGDSAPNGPVAGLGVLKRSDNGQSQLTYQGKPLYLFKLDTAAGQAKGNLVKDKFAGADFEWFATVVSAAAPATTTTTAGGGGYGGY